MHIPKNGNWKYRISTFSGKLVKTETDIKLATFNQIPITLFQNIFLLFKNLISDKTNHFLGKSGNPARKQIQHSIEFIFDYVNYRQYWHISIHIEVKDNETCHFLWILCRQSILSISKQ